MPNRERAVRKSLSLVERKHLADLEQVVDHGLSTFVEVGLALLAIRDGRLYRAGYASFEEYLEGRWRLSRSRGYQLVDAARVAGVLSTTVDIGAPTNEAQARELVPLLTEEEALVQTWRALRASHGEAVTAELVRAAVQERLAREAYVREPSRAREPERPNRLPPVSPRSTRGGVYELGGHRLVCGDATEGTDVERLLGAARASLLFTSPPYLDLRRFGAGQNQAAEHLAGFLPLFADRTDLIVLNLGVVRRAHTVERYWDVYLAAAEQAGLKLLAWNVWWKGAGGAHPSGRGSFFPPEHEWLFVLGKAPRQLFRTVPNLNAGRVERMSRRQRDGKLKPSPPLAVLPKRPIGSVLEQPQEKSNRGLARAHPAVFPVGLPQAYIEALTAPGDVVVDCFAGAGSTLVACELTGRRCLALELERGFCDLIRTRYAALRAAGGGS